MSDGSDAPIRLALAEAKSSMRGSPIFSGRMWLAWTSMRTQCGTAWGGSCASSHEDARWRAIGEAIERYALLGAATIPGVLVSAGTSQTRRHVPLKAFIQTERPVQWWMRGMYQPSLTQCLVPAQVALLGWNPPPPEMRWCRQTTVGAAAHPSSEEATTRAAMELLERECIRRVWRGEMHVANARSQIMDLLPPDVVTQFGRRGVTINAWFLVGAPRPVALVAIHRRAGELITFGAGTQSSAGPALLHGFEEAVAVRAALFGSQGSAGNDARRLKAARASLYRGEEYLSALAALEHRGSVADRCTPGSSLWQGAKEFLGAELIAVPIAEVGEFSVVRVLCVRSSTVDGRLAPEQAIPYLC